MNITVKIQPYKKMRYATIGDWVFNKRGDLLILVADLGNWRYNMLVAVHEIVEVLICKHRGITQNKVDKFDMAYEKRRKAGDFSEPGDDPKAPYSAEHGIATGVERILAALLGVSWKKYEAKINSLE